MFDNNKPSFYKNKNNKHFLQLYGGREFFFNVKSYFQANLSTSKLNLPFWFDWKWKFISKLEDSYKKNYESRLTLIKSWIQSNVYNLYTINNNFTIRLIQKFN